MGRCHHLLGDREEARRLFSRALPTVRELGDQSMVASLLHDLADLSMDDGDFEAARVALRESLSIRDQIQDRRDLALSMEGVARWLTRHRTDDAALRTAATLLGAADARRRTTGVPVPPYLLGVIEQAVQLTRASLGDDRFAQARESGRSLALRPATDLARRALER
jgi:hypothetical protein